MTESCSSAAVAGEVEVLRLELVEAVGVAGGGGGAHLSTNDIDPPAPEDAPDVAAAAAASLLPKMKSLRDELEPHFEDPDGLPDKGSIAIRAWTIWQVV